MDKALTISERFSAIRHHFRLTKDALADIAGISGTAVNKIETGETASPKADVLAKVATKLGVNLDWLILGEGPMLKGQQPEATDHTKALHTESETLLKLAVAEAKLQEKDQQLADKDKQLTDKEKLIDRLWGMIPAALGKMISNLEAAGAFGGTGQQVGVLCPS